ncbi:hypothetical protein GHT06_014585 [Daphnia sinensis]|uniref:Uncharacterized protein n=1 Tax=Daphnia sinensis TaxID=1820382 RepID=A0AAD5PS42_9CRUS|nr:hypothetical protein GHT06_014585 [Daphnia sinensis]
MPLFFCDFLFLQLAAINESRNGGELLTSFISSDLALKSAGKLRDWRSITMDIKVGNAVFHQFSKNVACTSW